MTKLPALLAALIGLAGCSAQVEGLAGQASALVGERCGWVQDAASPFAPELACQVVTAQGAGLWRVGDDPCDAEPVSTLRVEAGESYAEWARVGAQASTESAPCGSTP